MVHSSETQGAKHANKAVMPQSVSLTQNLSTVHLKAQVSDGTHRTQCGQSNNAPPKSAVRKVTAPTPGVAWTWALFGHRSTRVVALQNHSGIPTALQVSRGGAATHIVRNAQRAAVRRRHRLSPPSSKWCCLAIERRWSSTSGLTRGTLWWCCLDKGGGGTGGVDYPV